MSEKDGTTERVPPSEKTLENAILQHVAFLERERKLIARQVAVYNRKGFSSFSESIDNYFVFPWS